ncbi:MAG: hypothetical protein IPQ05_20700 [Leptospiraceae bacterium]|nr:hypothetical protein [Leptospiraceae bacterium]MBK9502246.1 hypothetical protein [Leptospiraceae bacterium]MBL0266215.1 hypothetical protein [Leptospiraceae bacterium]
MKQNNQPIKDNDMNKQNTTTTIVRTIRELPLRIVRNGMLLAIGFFGTTILAVAISGTIKTWTTGEVLKSADLNTTIASLQTAIQNIPNWTKAANGNDAYYTAGNVGIGTASPSAALNIYSTIDNAGILAETTSTTKVARLQLKSDSRNWGLSVEGSGLSNNGKFNVYDYTASQYRMSIDTSGNVGIGTTSPVAKLDVNATTLSGAGMKITLAGGNQNYLQLNSGADGNAAWGLNDNVSRDLVFYRYNSSGTYLDGPLRISNATGAVTVTGALSKGSGTFDIAHPDPSMPKNARLRHSFVESPTAGDNIYRWQIKVMRENGKFFIKLPKYWTHLNTNPMVWVSSAEQPAASFGYVDMTQEKVIVQADRVGTYNVLLLGTRKDSLATNNWKELGMEYISKGIGEAEKILSYNAQPEFGEEPQEQKSLRLRSGNDQQAANEKKLLALEESNQKLIEDNKRLRDDMARLRGTLEDRLRAIENTQMAKK